MFNSIVSMRYERQVLINHIMKYFSNLTTLMMMLFLSFAFVSCDDNDGEGGSGGGARMRPTSILFSSEGDYGTNGQWWTLFGDIQYNSGLQVSSYKDFGFTDNEYWIVRFSYNSNSILKEIEYEDGKTSTVSYVVNNGLITQEKDGGVTYRYSYSNNHMTSGRDSSTEEKLVWEDGVVTEELGDSWAINYIYSQIPTNLWLGAFFDYPDPYNDIDGALVMQGYFGTVPAYLLGSCEKTSSFYGKRSTKYEYELNTNGYPTLVTITTENGSGYKDVVRFKINWENY